MGLALKDDAALMVPPPDTDFVITVDTVVAGVHFFKDDPAQSIAEKALGVNLSDLAAKGAQPLGFVLALSLPDDWREDWLAQFADGLGKAAEKGACPLLGGDTTRTSGPLTISITVFGAVPKGKMVRRTTAQPGDDLPELVVLPLRRGRCEPRVRKRRPKEYDLMNKPRAVLREALRAQSLAA